MFSTLLLSAVCWADGIKQQSAEAAEAKQLADLAEAKQWKQLGQLISGGGDINAVQPDGMTALHWAVFHQQLTAVEQLVAAKADVNAKTRYDQTPLSIACTLNSDQIIASLLKADADADQRLPGGISMLMLAARTGNAKAVRHLITKEVDVNASERQGQTSLMWAAAEGNVGAVQELINAKADLNASDKAGFTAMLYAVRQGHQQVADLLLKAGVDVNYAMKATKGGNRAPREGTSALLMAVESGHFELAMFLVDHGANPNDQRSGFTPLHVLTWVRRPKVGEDPDGDPSPRGSGRLTSLEFVKAIVAAGADVNVQLTHGKGGKAFLNAKGATPFLMAGKTADLPLMSLLIELGGDPTIANVDGCTALMAAAGVGVRAVGEEPGSEIEVIEAIDFLIGHGLDVNTIDRNKETAMHGAAYRNFPQVVEHLAACGAASTLWNHKNVSGWTPVMIAEGHRPGSFKPSPETVQALQAAMSTANGR